MSLKAKLEAVIYAAEEPVTLAQLAGVFADEALELKAEQEAAAQKESEEPGAEDAEVAPPAQEPLPELESPADAAAEEAAAGETAEAGVTEASDAAQESAGPDAAQVEAEAKRAARQRDREVRGVIKTLLDELISEYAVDARGVEVREIAGGYRMATKPECHDAVRAFIKGQKPALKLSLPALETLAVIAYKQPITAPEVNEIRGVDSSGVFGSLLARKLIATAGRKPVIGRPILYKTTREFLLRFGLKDVSELPSMEEFEKMAASELEESELAGDEAPAGESFPEFNPDPVVETETGDAEGQNETAAEPEPEPPATAEPGESPAEAPNSRMQ